jgi:hypothetical protein
VTDGPLPDFTRRRVGRLAEDVLNRAGVVGELPTPLEAVRETAGVRHVADIKDLPPEAKAKKPWWLGRVLGAFVYRDRTAFIDRTEPLPRQRFTEAHEATHSMCKWHEPALKLDDVDTLEGRRLLDAVEDEANFGAAYFIFQGGRFHRRALKEQVSMRTPLDLAGDYAASRHATLRFYAEHHPDAVGLLVAGRYQRMDGTLPIWHSVESPEFLRRFGRLADLLPGGALSICPGDDAPLAEIVAESRTSLDPPTTRLGIPDLDGTKHKFDAEAFFNQYCHFVLVVESKARRLGRRVRLAG